MNDRIGIEFLSVFNLPPVQFVELVAELGCRYLSTGLSSTDCNPHGYLPYSLRDDTNLRRDMITAMHDCDVSISLGEGFVIRPNADVRDLATDLDIMCELGVTRINTVSLDSDLGRSFDQIASLAEMANAVGVETTVEFVPGLPIGDLATALAAINHVANPFCRLLIDTMHLIRTGNTVADLAVVDPAQIGYAQISDVPLVPTNPNYWDEAMYERMVSGEGELPLHDIFSVVPREVVVGIEIPLLSLAEAGVLPHERLAPCVKATDRLLAGLTQ